MIETNFTAIDEAIAALKANERPLVLARFGAMPLDTVIIAVNDAAAAHPTTPQPGDHPDQRRDRDMTADIELDYLYRQVVGRGHAQQVISLDGGRLYELEATRVMISSEPGVYAFIAATLREPA
jgi:hypothetical protein